MRQIELPGRIREWIRSRLRRLVRIGPTHRVHMLCFSRFSNWSVATYAGLLAVFALVAGCGQPEPIREYTVPRAPQSGALWFFKLIGPQAAVDNASQAVKDFVASVKFDARTGLPDWELPAGWTEETQPNSVRYSTITIPGTPSLEVAVTQINSLVPVPQDDLRAQSNVLREQLKLPDVPVSEDVNLVAPAMSIDGHSARMFDFVGETPQHGATRLYAFMIALPTPPANIPQPGGREFPLTYTAPAEWKDAAQTQFSLVSMSAGNGSDVASITVTPAMGDPLSNVNRWRNQAGLKPVEQAELVEVMSPIESDNLMILYTEAVGETRGILGAMIPVESGQTYFVKLDGPPARVNDEKGRFRKFLESFRLAIAGEAAPRRQPDTGSEQPSPARTPVAPSTEQPAEKPPAETPDQSVEDPATQQAPAAKSSDLPKSETSAQDEREQPKSDSSPSTPDESGAASPETDAKPLSDPAQP
ncbi:MAG: hypothetical protein ACK5Q5_07255 [Planctomycetaceae bacterium]